jgi:uncharacterized phage protein gp47/JayE
MAFQRPTLDQLIERVKSDFKSGLNVADIIRRSFLGVIARAMAGLSHLQLGYLDWISKQVIPDTAEDEQLIRWAAIFGLTIREATFAELTITITGNAGGVVPAGEIFQTATGLQYELDAEVTIGGGGSITGKAVAVEPGTGSNLDVGAKMSLVSPIANVNSEATVTAILTIASDTETVDSLRSRLLNRMQLPPLGGSANDYITWAKEVGGVTRSWVLPLYTGPGTVAVSFVTDDEEDIIPPAPKVAEVLAYIEERKPVTALLSVFAPVAAPMDMTIKIKPNTVEVQNNILSELRDLVKRDATLAGSYKGPGLTNDGSILLSKINQSVSIAVGLEDHEIQDINGLAPANVVPNDGELVTLGNITWQALA